MSIRPFLSGQAFEPEIINAMPIAVEGACDALGLRLTADPATRVVAEKVLELAQRGVRDAPTLLAMTLKEFNLDV